MTAPQVFVPRNHRISTITSAVASRIFLSGWINVRRGFSNDFEFAGPETNWESFGRHGVACSNVVFSGGGPATTRARLGCHKTITATQAFEVNLRRWRWS